MTATEIFKLFLKEGLEPNERLAFITQIRVQIRLNNCVLCKKIGFLDKMSTPQDFEKDFIERLVMHTKCGWYRRSCCSLTSVMRYLLYYVPTITGNSRKPNKFLAKYDIEIPKGVGYKRYWESRLIKKWQDFIKKRVKSYDKFIYSTGSMKYYLKDDTRV